MWIIFTILLGYLAHFGSEGATYCVAPSNNSCSSCIGYECHSLSYYVRNGTFYFTNDTIIRFLAGTHYLEASDIVWIRGVRNLSLIGNDTFTRDSLGLPIPTSQVHCNSSSGFGFSSSQNISVENILFSQCGGAIDTNATTQAALVFGQVSSTKGATFNITVKRVRVENSTGYGIFAKNVLGTSIIEDSVFNANHGTSDYFGGNARFEFADCQSTGNSTLHIYSLDFLFGYHPHATEASLATGLAIVINGTTCFGVNVDIDGVTAQGNTADLGGNIAIVYVTNHTDDNYVEIRNSMFQNGFSRQWGGGLRVYSEIPHNYLHSNKLLKPDHLFLKVINCTLDSNSANTDAGAVALIHNHFPSQTQLIVTFEYCDFTNSRSLSSGVAAVEVTMWNDAGHDPVQTNGYRVNFHHCLFSQSSTAGDIAISSTVYLHHISDVTFRNCTFEDNLATALVLSTSNPIFEGDTVFRNNIGMNGGAMIFCTQSLMYLEKNATVLFENNCALHAGGAIFSEPINCFAHGFCFFQVDLPYSASLADASGVHLYFENNTAVYAGDDVYGGGVDECSLVRGPQFNSTALFDHIFHLSNTEQNRSVVSSDPIDVCFCSDNILDCTERQKTVEVFPGEVFEISATTVGQRGGTVPGVINTKLAGSNNSFIERYQKSQSVVSRTTCANLSYTVYSPQPNVTLKLVVEQPMHDVYKDSYIIPPQLHIQLRECPWGFTLSRNRGKDLCDCADVLRNDGIRCNITNKTIERPQTAWIGYHNTSKGKSGVLIHNHCPFHYCIDISNNISLYNPDEQCAFHRSGVLCGKCKPGLSLSLGVSQCMKCTNDYLALLLVFIAAGIALVVLLISCNLTVTEGTINGLIFYANIVWVNQPTFFPDETTSPLPKLLTVFVAWLNLDFGIRTCFYNGLDAYAKIWLQFVFPVYIWVIVALIILLSRYSMKIAYLIGRNAVKVLATLFLLSFTKLLHTIIATLSVTYLTYPDGSRHKVWLYDGNVGYLDGKHIPLFIAGLLSLIFLVFPYVLVLLLIQCLERAPNNGWFAKPISVIIYLKPLFDAYTGPYRDQCRFWTGFLLLVRAILFMLIAFNYVIDPAWNLMFTVIAVILVLTLTWSFRGIYRRWPLDVLESSFFLNLGVLSAATSYTLYHGGSQTAVISTSVVIALLTFLGILVYHSYKQIIQLRACRHCTSHFVNYQSIFIASSEQSSSAREGTPLMISTSYSDYREPVLRYLDD